MEPKFNIYPGLPVETAPEAQLPPPSAPMMEGKMGSRKVMHLKNYVKDKANSKWNKQICSHREWEKNLWLANIFIIPLVVYPIVSLLGHLVIEICRDQYAETYEEIKSYLDGKVQTEGGNEAEHKLNPSDKEHITNLFTRKLPAYDSRLKSDKLYLTLKEYEENKVFNDALNRVVDNNHIRNNKLGELDNAICYNHEYKMNYLMDVLIPNKEERDRIADFGTSTREKARIVHSHVKDQGSAGYELANKLRDAASSHDKELQAKVLKSAGFEHLIPKLDEKQLDLYY